MSLKSRLFRFTTKKPLTDAQRVFCFLGVMVSIPMSLALAYFAFHFYFLQAGDLGYERIEGVLNTLTVRNAGKLGINKTIAFSVTGNPDKFVIEKVSSTVVDYLQLNRTLVRTCQSKNPTIQAISLSRNRTAFCLWVDGTEVITIKSVETQYGFLFLCSLAAILVVVAMIGILILELIKPSKR